MSAAPEQRKEGEHHAPGPENIGLERRARLIEVGIGDPLPGVVEDRRVVDQRVEQAELLFGAGAGPLDIAGAGDVQLSDEHLCRSVGDRSGRAAALLDVARRQDDRGAARSQLAAHLEADAAIPAGDERD